MNNFHITYDIIKERHQGFIDAAEQERLAKTGRVRSITVRDNISRFAQRVSDKLTTRHEPMQEVTLTVNKGRIG